MEASGDPVAAFHHECPHPPVRCRLPHLAQTDGCTVTADRLPCGVERPGTTAFDKIRDDLGDGGPDLRRRGALELASDPTCRALREERSGIDRCQAARRSDQYERSLTVVRRGSQRPLDPTRVLIETDRPAGGSVVAVGRRVEHREPLVVHLLQMCSAADEPSRDALTEGEHLHLRLVVQRQHQIAGRERVVDHHTVRDLDVQQERRPGLLGCEDGDADSRRVLHACGQLLEPLDHRVGCADRDLLHQSSMRLIDPRLQAP